ncbi:MAG: hypothetical protein ISS47_04340 [Candidatus Omnitrophica bacterium]|nr:hypothetical protein [Candidatus Omnitrophota bacterium]
MEKQFKKIVSDAISKRNKLDFKCFKKGCSENAINSHSQSLSNALRMISERGHLVRPKKELLGIENKGIDAHFQEIGINQASTFKGFCSKHDHEYFKEVDSLDVNNLTKEVLARLAFRTLAYEARIKEQVLFYLEYVAEKARHLLDVSSIQGHAEGIRNNLRISQPYYYNKFIKIFDTQNYKQINGLVFVLNKMVPLSTSSVIDPTMINPGDFMKGDLGTPLNLIFFTLIPSSNSSMIILTYFSEQKKKLKNFIRNFKSLENIIFNHCEEVLMKPSFYSSLSHRSKEEIINALKAWVVWEKSDFPSLFKIKLKSPIHV